MSIPWTRGGRMTPEEFQTLYPHVIGWIYQTLAAHWKVAKAVGSLGFPRLSRYFSEERLTSTKVVVIDRADAATIVDGAKPVRRIRARRLRGHHLPGHILRK